MSFADGRLQRLSQRRPREPEPDDEPHVAGRGRARPEIADVDVTSPAATPYRNGGVAASAETPATTRAARRRGRRVVALADPTPVPWSGQRPRCAPPRRGSGRTAREDREEDHRLLERHQDPGELLILERDRAPTAARARRRRSRRPRRERARGRGRSGSRGRTRRRRRRARTPAPSRWGSSWTTLHHIATPVAKYSACSRWSSVCGFSSAVS